MDRRQVGGRGLAALGLIASSLPLGAGTAMAHSAAARLLDVHDGAAHPVGAVQHPAAVLPLGLLLAASLALPAALVRWRRLPGRGRARVMTAALALALALFTFETARHSVHHLIDPGAATECSVLAGSQGLAWGPGELLGTEPPPLEVTGAPVVVPESAPRVPIHRPHQGRAPPA
jgi:hypothetical protein